MSNAFKLILAIGLALVTTGLIIFWLGSVRKSEESFAVYVTTTDVVADKTIFGPTTVKQVNLPERFSKDLKGVVYGGGGADMQGLVGRVFTQNVTPGTVVLKEHLEANPAGKLSSRLTAGMRALTIPVNASTTVGYFVEPGSLVDLLGTVVRSAADAAPDAPVEARVSTLTLLQAVRVLAVGAATDPQEYRQESNNGYATVTIEVSPADAEKLVFAMQQVQGGLTLLLRHPDDTALVETPSISWSSWLDKPVDAGGQ